MRRGAEQRIGAGPFITSGSPMTVPSGFSWKRTLTVMLASRAPGGTDQHSWMRCRSASMVVAESALSVPCRLASPGGRIAIGRGMLASVRLLVVFLVEEGIVVEDFLKLGDVELRASSSRASAFPWA